MVGRILQRFYATTWKRDDRAAARIASVTLAFGLGAGKVSVMNMVQEIKAAIDSLSPAERSELDRLLAESRSPLDPEVDSPELEAELLKAIDGPYTPYSTKEMQEIGERIIREKRQQ